MHDAARRRRPQPRENPRRRTRVFTEHGAAASTEQVAAEAGVALGTIFRHAEAAAKHTVIDLLPGPAVDESVTRVRDVIAGQLTRAQNHGDVRPDEVMALLVALAKAPSAAAGHPTSRNAHSR